MTPIFVNSYVSHFGQDYGGFDVNDPAQGIDNKSLSGVVNVNLEAYKVFHFYNIAEEHEYAANWYAGSASTAGTSRQVGLLWSPLIKGASVAPRQSRQTWTLPGSSSEHVGPATQFVLKPGPPAKPVVPAFDPAAIQYGSQGGNASIAKGRDNKVTGVTLNDSDDTESFVRGDIIYPEGNILHPYGLSFTYDFTGGSTDGAQLQILINGEQYFAMTGSVAESSILPGSGQFSATLGLWWETHLQPGISSGITIRLVPSQDDIGTPTTVNVTNFQLFKE